MRPPAREAVREAIEYMEVSPGILRQPTPETQTEYVLMVARLHGASKIWLRDRDLRVKNTLSALESKMAKINQSIRRIDDRIQKDQK
jgi:hypothetical protein